MKKYLFIFLLLYVVKKCNKTFIFLYIFFKLLLFYGVYSEEKGKISWFCSSVILRIAFILMLIIVIIIVTGIQNFDNKTELLRNISNHLQYKDKTKKKKFMKFEYT